MTKEQVKKLYEKWTINSQEMTFPEFIDSTTDFGQYIGVQWSGMFLGIEQDGYSHT